MRSPSHVRPRSLGRGSLVCHVMITRPFATRSFGRRCRRGSCCPADCRTAAQWRTAARGVGAQLRGGGPRALEVEGGLLLMEPEKLCDALERSELCAIRRDEGLDVSRALSLRTLDGEAPELRLPTSARLPGMASPGTVITENCAEQSSAREARVRDTGGARDGLKRRGQRGSCPVPSVSSTWMYWLSFVRRLGSPGGGI